MKDLFFCQECGFLSTIRNKYTTYEDQLICVYCAEQIYDNNEYEQASIENERF